MAEDDYDLTGPNESANYRERNVGSGRRKKSSDVHPSGETHATGFKDIPAEENVVNEPEKAKAEPYMHMDTSGYRAVGKEDSTEDTVYWDEEKIEQLTKMYQDLREDRNYVSVEDSSIKEKIAMLSLQLFQETPIERHRIRERSAILGLFDLFQFNDELDDAFSIAAEIAADKDVETDTMVENWKDVGEILKEYVRWEDEMPLDDDILSDL